MQYQWLILQDGALPLCPDGSVSSAEHVCNIEHADRRQQHQQAAGDNAGQGQWQHHTPEGLPAIGAEVAGGFQKIRAQLFENRIQWQDHKRQ